MSTSSDDPFAKRPEVNASTPPLPGEPPAYAQQGSVPPSGSVPPGHAPSPQYAQPGPGYYGPPPKDPGAAKNWMNITSLALSLSALLFGITAIAGIVFGHLGLSAAKRGEANNRGLGLAGLIVGYVLLALGILATIAFFVFFGWLATECGGSNPADWCDSGVTYEVETG